jgi:hypothetical protein
MSASPGPDQTATSSPDSKNPLDALTSDPNTLGWMQGTPPPPNKLIRFEDNDTLSFPKIRWTLSHMRELVPTARVWRGRASARSLGDVDAAQQTAIDALTFSP